MDPRDFTKDSVRMLVQSLPRTQHWEREYAGKSWTLGRRGVEAFQGRCVQPWTRCSEFGFYQFLAVLPLDRELASS